MKEHKWWMTLLLYFHARLSESLRCGDQYFFASFDASRISYNNKKDTRTILILLDIVSFWVKPYWSDSNSKNFTLWRFFVKVGLSLVFLFDCLSNWKGHDHKHTHLMPEKKSHSPLVIIVILLIACPEHEPFWPYSVYWLCLKKNTDYWTGITAHRHETDSATHAHWHQTQISLWNHTAGVHRRLRTHILTNSKLHI